MKPLLLRHGGWLLALASSVAWAQGDGGSQTSCELKYSTCKQTARADYQFCKNDPGGKNCAAKRDAALNRCTAANSTCQN